MTMTKSIRVTIGKLEEALLELAHTHKENATLVKAIEASPHGAHSYVG